MGSLEGKTLPFAKHSAGETPVQIHPDTDREFLLDTALNAFPDVWQPYLETYLEDHPEFITEHGLVMPSCPDDEDFDAIEILTMQVVSRRDVVQALKEAFIKNGQSEGIIRDVVKHPMMQNRIQYGEVFPICENRGFDAA